MPVAACLRTVIFLPSRSTIETLLLEDLLRWGGGRAKVKSDNQERIWVVIKLSDNILIGLREGLKCRARLEFATCISKKNEITDKVHFQAPALSAYLFATSHMVQEAGATSKILTYNACSLHRSNHYYM